MEPVPPGLERRQQIPAQRLRFPNQCQEGRLVVVQPVDLFVALNRPLWFSLGGGVAANRALRERITGEAEARGLTLVIPRPGLCTDNGAMIGAAGARRLAAGVRAGLDLDARPSLPLAR